MDEGGAAGRQAPAGVDVSRSSPPVVPSPLGRKVLTFEFVVLVEYWVAPLFLGVTNYAGYWSDAGVPLFLLLVGSLIVFVFVPLIPHLRGALRSLRNRVIFHGIWSGTFVLMLFTTNIIQFSTGPATPAVLLGTTTVYSPFGAWSSVTMWVPALQLWATWNLEGPTVLLLLSLLSAASVLLGPLSAVRACPIPPRRPRTWAGRFASVGVLAPLGFISGCPGCAPMYFAALATVAPASAESASAAIPLVPWIGFAGLLYLAGFALALYLIRRATDAPPSLASAVEGS